MTALNEVIDLEASSSQERGFSGKGKEFSSNVLDFPLGKGPRLIVFSEYYDGEDSEVHRHVVEYYMASIKEGNMGLQTPC